MSQAYLFSSNRFRPLFLTQFCGAFNDNLFKNALTVLISFGAAQQLILPIDQLVPLSLGLFILPFFLFSATAGQLADKYDKAMLVRRVKLVEVILMLLAGLGFVLDSYVLLFVVLFLMGCQSTIFGPLKYSLLPQHLEKNELIAGNGLIEMGTFMSILLGTIGGGLLINIHPYGNLIITAAVFTVALLGWWFSRGIPDAPPPEPDIKVNWNFLTETLQVMSFAYRNRSVFIAILAISWFWFIGAIYLSLLPEYSKTVLHGSSLVYTLLLTFFSLGIGLGSVACERLSHVVPKMTLVLLGGLGLTVFSVDIQFSTQAFLGLGLSHTEVSTYFDHWQGWHLLLDFVMVGFVGGLYIVPLYAYIQAKSDQNVMARIISANNILNAAFMVTASLCVLLIEVPIPMLFLAVGVINGLMLVGLLVSDSQYRSALLFRR